MSFTEAVRSVYRNYARFDGRAPRSEYWWFQLFNVLVALGAYVLVFVLLAATRSFAVLGLFALGLVIYGLLSLIPSLAVTVRRLHDTDKSGWWLLIVLVPYLGALVVLIFMVLPSTVGFNRYGPPYGERGGEQKVHYSGPERSVALQRFAQDAQDAARSGFEPVWQEWRSYPGGEVLEVTYRPRPLAPPWHAPVVGFPGGGADGRSSPLDGPPPNASGGPTP